MLLFVALFASGNLVFFQLPTVPGWPFVAIGAALCGWIGLTHARQLPVRRALLAFCAGLCWANAHTLLTWPAELPIGNAPAVLTVNGQVVSLVERRGAIARFVFLADSVATASDEHPGSWRLRLSWRDAPAIEPGERIELSARIKPAHGYAVPGGWDYEGWLARRGIRYTGYVLSATREGATGESCCAVQRWRQRIATAIERVPASEFARGVIRALVIGDKSALSGAHKALFRDTGTSHLMAISGLHIGLVAALGYVAFAAVWRRIPALVARVPANVAGAVVALSSSGFYAMLAGFTLPTQRALIMLGVVALATLIRGKNNVIHLLGTAALAVLAAQPAAIIAPGFWLSFGAVLIIIATIRLAPRGESRWKTAIRVQFVVALAIWPLLAVFGMPVSSTAVVVNVLAVPLFSFVVVPFSLLGSTLLLSAPEAGIATLAPLASILDTVELTLIWAADVAWVGSPGAGLGLLGALLGALAGVVALAPHGFPFRLLSLPLLAVLVLPRQAALDEGDFNLHVLDVGQGLSIVVETRSHVLLYDTGPAYASGFSAARAAVIPFLESHGHRVVDRLVLSHADNDHAGGAAAIVDALHVREVNSGEPEDVAVAASHCRRGDAWRWDGVVFRYLYPYRESRRVGNNASCVLQISNGRTRVLLSGDIEAQIERRLVSDDEDQLRADVVIVPHHGSATSSTGSFVDATQARYAVYTSGWSNRYGFPARSVDARWKAAGARRLDTASAGTISFTASADTGLGEPICQRVERRRFWSHDSGLASACHAVSSRSRQAGGD